MSQLFLVTSMIDSQTLLRQLLLHCVPYLRTSSFNESFKKTFYRLSTFWCSFLEFITPKIKCSWVHNFIIIVHIYTTEICPNESSRYPALNWHFYYLENYEALWNSWTLCLLLWLSRMIKSCTTILLTAYEPTPNVSGQIFIHEYQTEFIHFRKDGKKIKANCKRMNCTWHNHIK